MKIVAFLALVIVLQRTFDRKIFSKNTCYLEAAVQTCALKSFRNIYWKIKLSTLTLLKGDFSTDVFLRIFAKFVRTPIL